jgi:hypothetical protein
MAKLTFLILHCTATPEGRKVSKDNIRQMHLAPANNPNGTVSYKGKLYPTRKDLPPDTIGGVLIKNLVGRGWNKVGYSDMFHLEGNVENLTPYDEDDDVEAWEITNGAVGMNSISRHVVYVGGIDKTGKPKDTRTEAQKMAMEQYVLHVVKSYPTIKVAGHYHFAAKACPSFDVEVWLRSIGVSDINIHTKK